MKRMYHLMLTIFSIILTTTSLTSCSDDMPQPDQKLTGNTVIVYMGAENSLARNSYYDINEMKLAMSDIPDNCQLVVFQDAELKPVIYHMTKKGMTTWKTFNEELDSSNPETVKSVLYDIIKNFPSEKYSLVLWSHGDGWREHTRTRSIIVDNGRNNTSNIGNWLNIREFSDILSSLPRMEYIMFDACFMQTVEVVSELYIHTPYIIASPAEIPGNGAPYQLIMKELCHANIQGIIEKYAYAYPNTSGVLLSAVSSENFPDFCEETAKHIPLLFNKENMPKTTGIQIYIPEYGSAHPYQSDHPVPYDIRSAMHRFLSDTDYKTWELQWSKTILYPKKCESWASIYSAFYYGPFHKTMQDPDHYGGISMHIPHNKYNSEGWNEQFQQTKWYHMTSWDKTGW